MIDAVMGKCGGTNETMVGPSSNSLVSTLILFFSEAELRLQGSDDD